MKWLASLLLASGLLFGGCMTVPPEVVQLSALTTNDTKALHDGYRGLVRKHFAALRKVREQEFAAKVLYPYIEDAIAGGHLIEVVRGDVVFDVVKDEFVKPDPARAALQKLDTLNLWTRQVAEEIEGLRKDAFADLDKLEAEVMDKVDQAFGNVIRGGTTIHAYLLSLQKVEAAQNEFLKKIGLEDLPKKLNDALDDASTQAAKWTAKVDDVGAKVDKAKGAVKKAKDKVKGK